MSDYTTDQRVPLPEGVTLRDYFAAKAAAWDAQTVKFREIFGYRGQA